MIFHCNTVPFQHFSLYTTYETNILSAATLENYSRLHDPWQLYILRARNSRNKLFSVVSKLFTIGLKQNFLFVKCDKSNKRFRVDVDLSFDQWSKAKVKTPTAVRISGLRSIFWHLLRLEDGRLHQHIIFADHGVWMPEGITFLKLSWRKLNKM